MRWNPTVGDVMLTRGYGNENNNTSPGFWNHTAIVLDSINIVHALENKGVILDTIDNLLKDVKYCAVLRLNDGSRKQVFARKAVALEGSPYRTIASIFNFLRRSYRGENCVSVARKAYKQAYNDDPRWKLPDDIFEDRRFRIVGKRNIDVYRRNGRLLFQRTA